MRPAGHIAAASGAPRAEPNLLYASASQTNLDRNSVDMDRERAAFADNAVKYEATLRFINGNVRTDARRRHQGPVGRRPLMSMFNIFDVAGSAVERAEPALNVVASNLANADTVAGPDGQPQGAPGGVPDRADGPRWAARPPVRVSTVVEDQSPGRRVHDPKHPAPTPRAT